METPSKPVFAAGDTACLSYARTSAWSLKSVFSS